MSESNGKHDEIGALQRAADRFNALLDQYGPRPRSTQELVEFMTKQMPRYALAMMCAFGVIGALVGLAVAAGVTRHAAPGLAGFFGIWGVVFGLLIRKTRWAYAYIFGATMFAARGLLPWECMWNALKHYGLAFETMKESYTTIKESEAIQKALEETRKGENVKRDWRWKWKRGIHIEKKL
jgi:hypothetical protein